MDCLAIKRLIIAAAASWPVNYLFLYCGYYAYCINNLSYLMLLGVEKQ